MGFPQSSRAYADMRRPRPWGVCDRCGFRYFLDKLNFQYDWRGNQLQNLRILVDHRCDDVPQPQLRPIVIGPDPVPVKNPRPGFAASQMGSVPAPPYNGYQPDGPGSNPYVTTDQGEIVTDDQGNGIALT